MAPPRQATNVKNGLAGSAEHEVVELLLTLAIPRSDVKQPPKALLGRRSAWHHDAPLAELRSVAGIGEDHLVVPPQDASSFRQPGPL